MSPVLFVKDIVSIKHFCPQTGDESFGELSDPVSSNLCRLSRPLRLGGGKRLRRRETLLEPPERLVVDFPFGLVVKVRPVPPN